MKKPPSNAAGPAGRKTAARKPAGRRAPGRRTGPAPFRKDAPETAPLPGAALRRRDAACPKTFEVPAGEVRSVMVAILFPGTPDCPPPGLDGSGRHSFLWTLFYGGSARAGSPAERDAQPSGRRRRRVLHRLKSPRDALENRECELLNRVVDSQLLPFLAEDCRESWVYTAVADKLEDMYTDTADIARDLRRAALRRLRRDREFAAAWAAVPAAGAARVKRGRKGARTMPQPRRPRERISTAGAWRARLLAEDRKVLRHQLKSLLSSPLRRRIESAMQRLAMDPGCPEGRRMRLAAAGRLYQEACARQREGRMFLWLRRD